MYGEAFTVCVVVTALVVGFSWHMDEQQARVRTSPQFRKFEVTYLAVYVLMMAGDWLQGPYIYALYDSFGYSPAAISALFVAGFGSSMVFGTFVGSLADRLGRRLFCLLYAALYIVSCLTKHVNDFGVLMLGRVLGGVATSLLFSVFDAWMVCEYNKQGFPEDWLSNIYSITIFCNSLVAIVAGVAAQYCADSQPLAPVTEGSIVFVGGYTKPFDLAVLCLVAGAAVLFVSWRENYGNGNGAARPGAPSLEAILDLRGLRAAYSLVKSDSTVLLCGLVQSLFEGAMYTFVFQWTPALTPQGGHPPYGTIFATFMVCCMAGSSSYGILLRTAFSAETVLQWVLLAATAALAVPVFTESTKLVFVGFLVFEVCVGLYFPAISTVKFRVVPEEARAAVYNIFRVPLNAIVLAVLLSDMALKTSFLWCALMLAAASACQYILHSSMTARKPHAASDRAALLKRGDSGAKWDVEEI